MSGFAGGFADGLADGIKSGQQRRAQQARLDESKRQFNLDFGIKQEQLGIAQSANAREQDKHDLLMKEQQRNNKLREGMSKAAKEGGTLGVIKYLEYADPMQAMNMKKAKSSLDESILKQQGMTHLNEKARQETLENGYKVGAGVAINFLKIPEEERPRLWKEVYRPIMSQMLGKNDKLLSENYTKNTEATLQGIIGLATPQSMAFQNHMQHQKLQVQYKQMMNKDASQSDLNNIKNDLEMSKAGVIINKLPKEQTAAEDVLRKEINNLSTDFIKVQDSFNRIKAAGTQPTAAGDLALIFNYMKMLDPGSVVRESEFATAKNAGSIPDRLRATWNGLLRGEKLSSTQRKDFLGRSSKLMEAQELSYSSIRGHYLKISKNRGLNPENVLTEFRTSKSQGKSKARENITKMQGVPDKLKQDAIEAIEKGADPEKVQARIQELMKGGGR